MDNKKIGYRINEALAAQNKKQLELAKHLHVQPNTISYFCSGKRTPNTQQIIEIAKFLNVSADFLLGLSDEPTRDTELKAVCEYTGLSQKAIEKILKKNKWEKETASNVIETDEFWYIVNTIDDARLCKDYLEPNANFIAASIKSHVNKDGVPEIYRQALKFVGVTGLGSAFKHDMTEIVIELFDKVVKKEYE